MAAAPDQFLTEWDDETDASGERLIATQDAVILGRPGGDIGVHASISVTQALLAAGVVDELRLVVAPTIVGRGKRLFDGLPPFRLQAIRSVLSTSGHLLVDFRALR